MAVTATAATAKKATAPKRTYRKTAAAADSTTKTAATATTKSAAAAKSGRPRTKTAPAKPTIGTTEPAPSQPRKAPPTPAATQINFRADEETRQALEILTRDGTSVSEAVRSAIRLAVWRMKEDQMVRDAEAAMADPADVAEMLRLRADLDSISAR